MVSVSDDMKQILKLAKGIKRRHKVTLSIALQMMADWQLASIHFHLDEMRKKETEGGEK